MIKWAYRKDPHGVVHRFRVWFARHHATGSLSGFAPCGYELMKADVEEGTAATCLICLASSR